MQSTQTNNLYRFILVVKSRVWNIIFILLKMYGESFMQFVVTAADKEKVQVITFSSVLLKESCFS